jgi:hypothetical protein
MLRSGLTDAVVAALLTMAATAAQQQRPPLAASYTSCSACVAAGFGWSLSRLRCGHFANQRCIGSGGSSGPLVLPPANEPLHPVLVPRVSLAQLHADPTLRGGQAAFILDATTTAPWTALQEWSSLDAVAAQFSPARACNYYPESRRTVDDYPFVVPLDEAAEFFADAPRGRPFPATRAVGPQKGQPYGNDAPPYLR